jgi:hypothetical protein
MRYEARAAAGRKTHQRYSRERDECIGAKGLQQGLKGIPGSKGGKPAPPVAIGPSPD